MAFSYLDEENIFDLYEKSVEFTEALTEPFPEFSRIARNKPHPKTPKRFPKTTDGTTSAIIKKSPRRTIQQLPTGVIETENKDDYWAIVADFRYRTKILPKANAEYDLIQKCWNTVENGQTFGSQVIYTPMLNHDGEVTPDYLVEYWGDIFVQPRKKSGYDNKYTFRRTWWQEQDVDKLIDDEEQRAAEAKEKNIPYESYWDLDNLREIRDAITAKDEKAKTPAEDELMLDPSGIEIVTGFQVGYKSIQYTFNPSKKLILRRKPNKDLRGKMPLDWYYYDVDGSNPLGRSLLDLVGPMQNLIDSDMQAYQYNRALALQPSLNVFGNVNTRQLSTAPNAVNKITDTSARVEPNVVDTTAIRDYPNIYGLQKSQLMGLTSGDPATAVSAEVGDPLAGKTPTAIKARNQATSVDDNAMRKGFEAFFENWSETAINLDLGERSGKEDMQLDEETAGKLRDLEEKGVIPMGTVREDNMTTVDYDTIDGPFKFRVNASTSKVNSEAEQLEALQILVNSLDSSTSLSGVVPDSKKLELWNAIVANSSVEDSEKLEVSEEELAEMQQMQAEAAQQAQMQAQGAPEMSMDGGELPIEGEEESVAPPEMILPEQNEPTDEEIANELRGLGVPEDLIAEVPAMIEKGYSDDEIMTSLGAVLEKEVDNG